MRPNLITRLKEEWNNLDPVDPLRGLIADAIDALAEQPAQQEPSMAYKVKMCPRQECASAAKCMSVACSSRAYIKPEQPAQQHDDTDLQDKDPELVEQPHCDDCGGFDPECPLAQPAQQEWPKPKFVRNVDGVPCITLVEHEYLMRSRTSPPASKPLPEDYTALEQALTRLQKRYADLEGRASKPLTDDPLQGAVDWLLEADGEYFCTATVQRTLRIGYNRAKRLCDTAKERAAHGIKGDA